MKYKEKLLCVGICGMLLTVVFLAISLRGQKQVTSLYRPESGEGSKTQEIQAEIRGEKYPLEITLLEIPYEESEVRKMLEQAAEQLEDLFLNGNSDLMHVITDVYMPSGLPDSDIAIEWHLNSWEYIEPDGTVKSELLTEAVAGQVQAVLSLDEQSLVWERSFQIYPLESLSNEQKLTVLNMQIQTSQSEPDRQILLPTEISGEPVTWYSQADHRWIWIAALTAVSLIALAAGKNEDEEKVRKVWERSMQLAYPDIVSRLGFYMGAGISTRKAWERLVERDAGKQNPACEEMRVTLYEMQSGVPESLAYERFGNRCRLPMYLKLGTLLSQNLRKGTKNLAELLSEEAKDAFENRKALAKKLGEECESKLLLPMILMLVTILVMVMYPAVVSFQM